MSKTTEKQTGRRIDFSCELGFKIQDVHDNNDSAAATGRNMGKSILDACCGSRMFWFDRQNSNTVFMDNRELETELCDGRKLVIAPDVIGDFRNMPFDAESFQLVVFDPPHLINAGSESWLAKKYGKLDKATWREDLKRGFAECFRVLKIGGVLVFKWNEDQIRIGEVVKLAPVQPLFGQRSGKTHWLVFMKSADVSDASDESDCGRAQK